MHKCLARGSKLVKTCIIHKPIHQAARDCEEEDNGSDFQGFSYVAIETLNLIGLQYKKTILRDMKN